MMSGLDEKSPPWPVQSRRESGPWKSPLRDKPWKDQYRDNLTKIHEMITHAGVSACYMRFIFVVALVILFLCFLAEPISQTQWIRDVFINRNTVKFTSVLSAAPAAPPQDLSFLPTPIAVSRPTHKAIRLSGNGFLPPTEADAICRSHNMNIWKHRSKRRKIYELIYLDGNTYTDTVEALHIHLGLRYDDVDYFIIAESTESFESEPKRLWLNPQNRKYRFWGRLSPYHAKMIYHAIQPKSNPSPIVWQPGPLLQINVTQDVGCEHVTRLGDSIAVHYTAKFKDGTVLGSSRSHPQGWPVVSTLGSSRVKGWDEGLQDMCIGEKRTLTISPFLAYGPEDRGAIPANSTITFETELVSIKGDEDTWQPWWDYRLTKDPLANEHQAFAYNEMYSQVIPHLPGQQKIQQGDVILIADVYQIPTPSALTALRNCDFPRRLRINSQVKGYSYWGNSLVKVSQQTATFFDGDDTVLPQTLRETDYFDKSQNNSDSAHMLDWNEYCGPCYGAIPPSNSRKTGCCNTCKEVEEAYAALSWAFETVEEHVEQCVRERKPFIRRIGYD